MLSFLICIAGEIVTSWLMINLNPSEIHLFQLGNCIKSATQCMLVLLTSPMVLAQLSIELVHKWPWPLKTGWDLLARNVAPSTRMRCAPGIIPKSWQITLDKSRRWRLNRLAPLRGKWVKCRTSSVSWFNRLTDWDRSTSSKLCYSRSHQMLEMQAWWDYTRKPKPNQHEPKSVK